jgi:hypothetical protein
MAGHSLSPQIIRGFKIWQEGNTIYSSETGESKSAQLHDKFAQTEHSEEEWFKFYSGPHAGVWRSELNKAMSEWSKLNG